MKYEYDENKKTINQQKHGIKSGQKFVIEFGRKHEPIAIIIPCAQYKKDTPRAFGILKNKATFVLNDDFEMSDKALVGL